MRKITLIALLIVMICGIAAAQENPPLLDLLALIPNNAATRGDLIYYTDLDALGSAYGAEKPASTAELVAAQSDSENRNIQHVAWWIIMRNSGLPGNMGQTWQMDDPSMPLGFDYLNIDRAISYGTPPADALILAGDFDEDAIRAALSERDYTQIDDSALWCANGDCESGGRINPAGREFNNPFGGDLGRQQPIVVADNLLMSSPSAETVTDHQVAAEGESDNLGELPAYRAAVEAITQQGLLLQAMIVDQRVLLSMGDFMPTLLFDRDTSVVLLETILENYQTLPAFNLMIMADSVTETEQVVQVALVYTNEADAQTAVEVLPTRIEHYQSLQTRRPMLQLLEERRATIHPPAIYTASNGQPVVLLTFSTPRPASLEELIDSGTIRLDSGEGPDVTAPGILYRLFVNMIFARDLGWLSTVSREDLEAMLNQLRGS